MENIDYAAKIKALEDTRVERNRLYDNGHTFMYASHSFAIITIFLVGILLTCPEMFGLLVTLLVISGAGQLSMIAVGLRYYKRANGTKDPV